MELNETIKGMTSEDYKERFIAEYVQAAIREKRLNKVLNAVYGNETPLFFSLSCPLSLLEEQHLTMLKYCNILERRARIEKIELPSIDEKKSEQ